MTRTLPLFRTINTSLFNFSMYVELILNVLIRVVGTLTEVINNRKFQITSVESSEIRLRKVSFMRLDYI